jgi:O-antigen ligase
VLALALPPLPTLALIVFYTLLVALPLLDPIFGLYWAILSVPVQELIHLPGGLSYTQAAMILAVGAWGLRILAHPERPFYHARYGDAARLIWLWGTFLWALLLAAVFSPYSRSEGIKETLRWFEAFLIWLMVAGLARRPWQIAGLIVCLLLAPAAEAMLGIAQFLTGAGPLSFRISPALPYVRAYGTIGQPNSFAGYLNMAWPLAVGNFGFWILDFGLRTKSKIQNRVPRRGESKIFLVLGFGLTTALLLAGLVASLSRGAWVGAACGAVGMAMALGRRARRWAIASLGVGLLGLALGGAGLLPSFLAARLGSMAGYLTLFDAGTAAVTPENFAVVERMAQMQAGWRMFLAHPLTGVGPGNYTLAYPAFAVGTWYASRGHAHNYYIHLAAETGVIGLLAYLALLAGVAYQAIVSLRRANSTFWRSAAIGCCGIIAAVVGHDLLENMHVLSMGIQLAAVWGLLVALEEVEQTGGGERVTPRGHPVSR